LALLKKSKIDQETNHNTIKKQMDDAMALMKTQLSKTETTVSIIGKQLETIKQDTQDHLDKTVSKHQTDRQQQSEDIQDLKLQLNRKDNELFEFKSDSDKQIAIFNEKLRQEQEQNTNAKEKLKQKDLELKTTQTNFSNKLAELKEKYSVDSGELQKVIDHKSELIKSKDKLMQDIENK